MKPSKPPHMDWSLEYLSPKRWEQDFWELERGLKMILSEKGEGQINSLITFRFLHFS